MRARALDRRRFTVTSRWAAIAVVRAVISACAAVPLDTDGGGSDCHHQKNLAQQEVSMRRLRYRCIDSTTSCRQACWLMDLAPKRSGSAAVRIADRPLQRACPEFCV
jgi:hypothetical protein